LLIFFNLEIFGVLLLVWLISYVLFLDEEYYGVFINTDLNFWIRILVVVVYLIVLIVNIGYKISLNFIFLILLYLITVRNFIVFFYMYEIVFILIIFSIIMLGYRYERLLASFMIMFYSFLFSSPVLLIILLLDHRFLIKNWLSYTFLINYFLVGSFIVKFPIFGFHYWLPVAHVEASTIGSIILAGLLLKLGSVGLIYVVIYLNFIVKLHWLGFGVLILILIILSLSDLKIIIAYSSVAHIRIVFYVIIVGSIVGKKRGYLYNILSWFYLPFNILSNWYFSLMEDSFIISN